MSELSRSDPATDEVLALEESKLLFITSELALLILRSGKVRAIKVQRDGRTISKLALIPHTLGRTVAPSDVELIRSHLNPKADDGATQACYAFVASLVGDSQLIKIEFHNETIDEVTMDGVEETKPGKKEEDEKGLEQVNAELDEDDIDIYGSADAKQAALSAATAARMAARTRLVLSMSECQTLYGYGPIRSAVIGTVDHNVRFFHDMGCDAFSWAGVS